MEAAAAEGELLLELERLENAMHSLSKVMATNRLFFWFGIFFVIGAVAFGLHYHIKNNMIGATVEASIQELTPKVLGCKSSFDEVVVDIFRGRVHIKNMTIHNPEIDPPFKTDYLFHVDEIVVDLQMMTLLTSLMTTVEVDKFAFNGAISAFEKPGFFGHSNVATVISNIVAFKNQTEKDIAQVMEEIKADLGKDTPKDQPPPQLPQVTLRAKAQKQIQDNKKTSNFIVHKVEVENLKAQVEAKTLTLANCKNDDLSRECDGTTVEDVLVTFAKQFAESIVKSVV